MQNHNSNRPTHDRYTVTKSGAAQLTTSIRDLDDACETLVAIGNLSLSGIRLVAPKPLPQGSHIRLTVRHCDVALVVVACVRWMAPKGNGEWFVGCDFETTIDPQFRDLLGIAGVLERRSAIRKPITVASTVRREQFQEKLLVDIVDYSSGGLCVQSKEHFESSENLMFEMGNGLLPFVARVQWSRPVDSQCVLGCRFFSPQNFANFCVASGLTNRTCQTSDAVKTSQLRADGDWGALSLVQALAGCLILPFRELFTRPR